jgi:hypothetical protein
MSTASTSTAKRRFGCNEPSCVKSVVRYASVFRREPGCILHNDLDWSSSWEKIAAHDDQNAQSSATG